VAEMEAIAVTFTFASFNGLSLAFLDFLYHNLKITRKIVESIGDGQVGGEP